MSHRKRWWRQLRLLCCTLLLASVAACTTTTRSVNESPRDPQMQRQAPSPNTTTQPSGRAQRAHRLTNAQMAQLTLSELETLLIREHTSAGQVAQIFGRPHSTTRSGDEIYWNYTHQFRDERRNVGGLKSLTILFDEYGRVSDYDFQDNSFNLQ